MPRLAIATVAGCWLEPGVQSVHGVCSTSSRGGLTSSSDGDVTCMLFFFQAEDGIRDDLVTGVQTCALPISVRRGVVATASYEARRYGVHSAMPSRTAQRLCPQAIFLPARFEMYRAVSQQIMMIFRHQTTLVEPLSLDEAYLDVTAAVRDLDEPALLARDIKRQIWDQTKLTASPGVSYSKCLGHID